MPNKEDTIVLGIDEVGRGPLAGPLVVGAVILPEKWAKVPVEEQPEWIQRINDSKKVRPQRREWLSAMIWENAPAVGLGWVSAEEIVEMGMSEALRKATREAVEEVQALHTKFNKITIDGDINFLAGTALEKYTNTMIKGDAEVKEVGAASIVAKVARDNYMKKIALDYPEYGFEKHVGYGTKLHREAIERYGLCPEHRERFGVCKGYANDKLKNTTEIGKRAEDIVANFLKNSKGQKILARNFKTKYCEIDIVSCDDEHVYFTEVKYRKYGGGIFAVDQRKQDQMRFASAVWEKFNSGYNKLSPLLAAASVAGEDFKFEDWILLV